MVKPEGKRPHGRPRCKWEDNIKLDIQEVRWGMDWTDVSGLVQETGSCECGNELWVP